MVSCSLGRPEEPHVELTGLTGELREATERYAGMGQDEKPQAA